MGTRLTDFDRLVADALRFHCEFAMHREVPGDYTTRWRSLPYANVAGLVSGSCLLEIDDQQPLTIRPGMALCITAGTHHRITHTQESFSASSLVAFTIFGSLDVLSLVEVPLQLPDGCYDTIVDANRQLAAAVQRDGDLLVDISLVQLLGFRLLNLLLSAGRMVPRSLERLRAIQRLAPLMDTIERNLPGIDLPGMCQVTGVSRSRLHEIFQHAFMCAPMDYVRHRRLQRACELLLGTQQPVMEIAELSGFGDPFHFSRVFKKVHGQSPSQYRAAFSAAQL